MTATKAISRLFLIAVAYGIFSAVYLPAKRLIPDTPLTAFFISASIAILLVLGVLKYGEKLSAALRQLADLAMCVSTTRWLAYLIVFSTLVRVAWILIYPPAPQSDLATYFGLAVRLIETGEYGSSGARALWPPGLPLFLIPTLSLFGNTWFVPAIGNIALFSLTIPVTFFLAKRLADERTARLATLALVAWPNPIFLSGLPTKELLVLSLMLLVIHLYLKSRDLDEQKWGYLWCLPAGVALGAATLTQPSNTLFVAVFVALEVVRRLYSRCALKRIAMLMVGAAVVVSPWTIRNYLVFDTFVLVTNTGGGNLYIANNPEATGGYVKGMTIPFRELDEVTANRMRGDLAIQWIKQNPADFVNLIFKKNVLFWADDSQGAYNTLKLGLGITGLHYLAFKGVSNLFWLTVLLMLLFTLWRHRNSTMICSSEAVLLMLSILYYLAIHSVFESGGRHHIATGGFLIVLASLSVYLTSPITQKAQSPRKM